MSDTIAPRLCAAALLLASLTAGAGTPAPLPSAALQQPALARLPNGRIDSNALFTRIAASREADAALLPRLDRYKLRALVAAVARNDGPAIDRGLRELIALAQAITPADQLPSDVEQMVMAISKAAAVEAYAGLAATMNEMNARRRQKQVATTEGDELTLLQARLTLCDLKQPCAPPEGKPLQMKSVPPDVLQPGVDQRQRRIDALAAAVAMIVANAARMDALARSILSQSKP